MSIFSEWCDSDRDENGKKKLWNYTEKADGRDAINERLHEIVRSHYDSLEHIADDIEELGYEGAATILNERMPRSPKARSGDLGEILASELVEEKMGFSVPVRRMRFKDGREMALRGDDFIGIGYDSDGSLWLLKGEAKSRITLSKTTITEARAALDADGGRCTPISLLFVADRLLERGGEQAELGRMLRNEVSMKTLPKSRIDHVLFTFSGNAPPPSFKADLQAAGASKGDGDCCRVAVALNAGGITDLQQCGESLSVQGEGDRLG